MVHGRDANATACCGTQQPRIIPGKPRQHDARHFIVERRLLALGGEKFRAAVMEKRAAGMKTEPGFAAVLGLQGDSYQAMLELEDFSDDELARLVDTTRSWSGG